MSIFCTLHIRSNLHASRPEDFFRPSKRLNLDLVDHDSVEASERRTRARTKLGLKVIRLPRYHWRLSTDGFVNSDGIYDHLLWIVGHLEPGGRLFHLMDADFECWLSVFWGGNGTGGGPLIDLKIAELLLLHKVKMGVAFYLEEVLH